MYISGSSSGNYITGMTSGMDIDTMVKNIMDAERIHYDEKHRDKQYLEWQMQAYQDSASTVKDFQDEYFNFLSADSNMLSSSTYMNYECTSDNSYVSATVSNSDMANTQYLMSVSQIASSAQMTSDSSVSQGINARNAADYDALVGEEIEVTLDGTVRNITIVDNDLQGALDDAFGANKILVTDTAGVISFDTVADSGSHELSLSMTEEAKINMGFEEDTILSNRIDPTKSLKEVSTMMNTPFDFDADGMLSLEINGVDFEFSESASLEHMMETINSNEEADVVMTYDPINDSFAISSNSTGAGSTLLISEEGSNFLTSAGLTTLEAGQDMIADLDGNKVVRSDNSFEYDGVVFTATGVTTEPVVIDINLNSDQLYDTITGFVEDYNSMIASIQSELDEERDYDYDPLTQAEKDDMTEEEITTWEEQVQVGIIGNDDMLENMLEEMRVALYTPVQGTDLTLSMIGITTDSYENGGELIIDEEKLKAALEDDPESVVTLFSNPSSTHPGTSSARTLTNEEKAVRYEEEGLMYRLYDISETYVSTTSDSNGNKGLLVEKSGFTDDYTEINSSMYGQIEDLEDRLYEMEQSLEEKEENYYAEFSVMETYLSEMNSQMEMIQSWFT